MQGWGTCGKAALGSPLSRFPSKVTAAPRLGAGAMIPHDAGRVPSAIATFNRGSHTVVSAFCSFIGHFRRSLKLLARAVVKGRLRGEISNRGLIGLYLALFTPSWEAEMRPGWSRLALRSLVRVSQRGATVRPRWPRLASSGVARSGGTFNSVAFDCISLHSLSSTRARDARFPPSRERRSAFVVTTHTTTVRAGAATAQWAIVVGRCRRGSRLCSRRPKRHV